MPANTLSLTNTSFTTWAQELSNNLEHADRFGRLFGSDGIMGIGQHASIIAGKEIELFGTIGNPIQTLRAGPSMAKSALKLVDVFSGEMFRRWSKKETTWLDIAIDICVVVGRIFNPFMWLNKIKAINLGRHAGWMGLMVTCSFTGACTLTFVQTISNQIDAKPKDAESCRAKTAQSFFDFLSSPWENGVGFTSTPVLGLIGSALTTVACGGYFLVEWVYGEKATKKVKNALPELQAVLQKLGKTIAHLPAPAAAAEAQLHANSGVEF